LFVAEFERTGLDEVLFAVREGLFFPEVEVDEDEEIDDDFGRGNVEDEDFKLLFPLESFEEEAELPRDLESPLFLTEDDDVFFFGVEGLEPEEDELLTLF
jgi:hypothetical protein